MSRTLNTGDPLYSSLLYLIAVDDDNSTVREFVTNTALTKETGVTVQSGTYGYDFNVLQNGSFSGFGIDLTGVSGGGLAINASNTHPVSVFVAFNALNAIGGTGNVLGEASDIQVPNIAFTGTNSRQITGVLGVNGQSLQATNQLAAATAASVCYTYNYGSGTGKNIYLNGALVAGPAADGGFGSGSGLITKIGYFPGQGSIDANIPFAVLIAGELSSTDVLRLHNSMTGSGEFALLNSSGGGGGGAGRGRLVGGKLIDGNLITRLS